ncbi:MAG: hypothetical protein K9H64_12320 [Bacteroidales bacterium]|nr:hypothetical protein [Bacteroidales bacterium]MCF8456829.1 hypothetical protein [Bacteroidales bacterium]
MKKKTPIKKQMEDFEKMLDYLSIINVELDDLPLDKDPKFIIYKETNLVTFNGFKTYRDLLEFINDAIDDTDSYLENFISHCTEKYKALIFIEDIKNELTDIMSLFEIGDDPFFHDKSEVIINKNIKWGRGIELDFAGYPNPGIRDIVLSLAKYQIDILNIIFSKVEHWERKINFVPDNIVWTNNDAFEILPPEVDFSEIKLTSKPFRIDNNPLDIYQLILLYHYFEKHNVFFSNYTASAKGELLYRLATYSKHNIETKVSQVDRIKADKERNRNFKKGELHNLNTLLAVFESIVDDIKKDILSNKIKGEKK